MNESAIAEADARAGQLIDAHPVPLDWIRVNRLALGRHRKSRCMLDTRLSRQQDEGADSQIEASTKDTEGRKKRKDRRVHKRHRRAQKTQR